MTTPHLYCSHCGAVHQPQARMCNICGEPLGAFRSQDGIPGGAINILPEGLAANHLLKQRYRILTQIGSGGYGDVYKAADTHIADRPVAIKEMRQHRLDDKEIASATAAFQREAFMLAKLTHPNLPSIYDYFTENGRWYLVMSFIEGKTLEEYLQKKPHGRLPVKDVLSIGIHLCSVLDYLHTRKPPIIFRDLKPANVMRTPQGQLYLIDFGIARHFKYGQAKDTMALGSPGYAAPEQYGKLQSTPQTDIYSLGSTLHQLLSGIDPSHAPFTHTPLDLPGYRDLSLLISSMLDIDASKRPTSMADIHRALRYIATGRPMPKSIPVAQPPASPPSPPGAGPQHNAAAQHHAGPQHNTGARFISPVPAQNSGANHHVGQGHVPNIQQQGQQRQQQLQIHHQSASQNPAAQPDLLRRGLLASGIAGLAVGGLLIASYFANRASQPSFPARVPARARPIPTLINNVTDANTNQFSPDALFSVAWSPDNTRIATASRKGIVQVLNAANKQLIVTYLGHVNNAAAGTLNTVSSIAWSPDASRIASASYDSTVQIWDATSSATLVTYKGHASPVLAVSWSPDGKRIVSADSDRQIHVWDIATQNVIMTYNNMHSQQVTTLSWSPDGKRIVSGSADQTARVWDATTGQSFFIYRGHTAAIEAVAWSPNGQRVASASDDQTVQIWDPQTGVHILSYQAHTDRVWTVAWSPDSKRIVSGSWDKTARVWNSMNGANIFTYRNHTNYVLSVMWSSDGKRIVSSDADGNLQIWIP